MFCANSLSFCKLLLVLLIIIFDILFCHNCIFHHFSHCHLCKDISLGIFYHLLIFFCLFQLHLPAELRKHMKCYKLIQTLLSELWIGKIRLLLSRYILQEFFKIRFFDFSSCHNCYYFLFHNSLSPLSRIVLL